MKMYLHTIEGKPAGFDGEQICYAQTGKGWHAPLVKTLKQIRREQLKTINFRKKAFGEDEINNLIRYDYVIVEMPDENL